MPHDPKSPEKRPSAETWNADNLADFDIDLPHVPIPFLPLASGVYTWNRLLLTLPDPGPFDPVPFDPPIPDPGPLGPGPLGPGGGSTHGAAAVPVSPATPIFPWWLQSETVRLDIDGRYPQRTLSGTRRSGLTSRVHWIASLSGSGNAWSGAIWFKDGDTASFPYTQVAVSVTRSWFSNQRKVKVTFSGGGAASLSRTYAFHSFTFHDVEFEFDYAEGTTPVTTMDTHAHPTRPPSLPSETLTLERVYQRAGFNVSSSPGGPVPISLAGADQKWSDQEMHDAMQSYWSRYAERPQWSLWVLFASLHETGTSLGGIMFDDIGAQHRQGTAIFEDAFIKNAPAGDANPAAWVQRMRFWTAAHEMGHAFNLAHSWQKALVSGGHGPWIPLSNQPEARSFMNYPYNVQGGQAAFFADFDFRFTDDELLFMRHAPERFVQMGNADWFDHHGFEQAAVAPGGELRLELRVHRERPIFEFLEPPALELKLTNVSAQPKLLPDHLLSSREGATVILKKDGAPARQFVPFAEYCMEPAVRVLDPEDSIYEPLEPHAGINGCDLAEPGWYTVQVCLHLPDGDVVSNPLRLRIAPPRGYDEEYLAQDLLGEDVGRVMALGGSRYLEGANDVLRETTERLADRRVALHAQTALTLPKMRDFKVLRFPRPGEAAALEVQVVEAEPEAAREELEGCLLADGGGAAESLGHIPYHRCMDRLSKALVKEGEKKEAAQVLDSLLETLTQRQVLPSVLRKVKARRDRYRK